MMHAMKRSRYLIITILVVSLVGGVSFQAYSQALPSIAPSSIKEQAALQKQPNISWSPYGEQAITVVGHAAFSADNGKNNALPTASIAKVMTALAILKQKPLALGQQGPNITINAAEVAVYQQDLAQNQSVVAVTAGEQISEYQALQAMLVPSATNIADISAPWAFGSMTNYLQYANQYASELGMTNTHFADASGFSPQTVSTPQDLLKLGAAAMANPVIAQIVAQPSVSLPVAGTVHNFNTALGQNGTVGIKTGNTDQAGGALLYAANYQGLLVIGVTLNAPDLGTAVHDSPEILSSFQRQLVQTTAVHTGQVLGSYKLPWGGNIQAVATKDLRILTWSGSKPAIEVSLKKISSKTGTQEVIGQAKVSSVTGEPAVSSPIRLQSAATGPSFWWRIRH